MKPKELGAATFEEAMEVLAEENRKRRANRKMLTQLLAGIGGALVVLVGLVWILKGDPPELTSMASLFCLFGAASAFTATHKAALKRVGELATKETAGYFLEALSTTGERDVIEVCEEALPVALSQVELPEDLDDYQRGLLYKLLSTSRKPEVAAAALECGGRIAGVEAILAYEKFHESASRHKDAQWQRLGARALQLLPDIRMRAARKIIEQKLGAAEAATEQEVERLQLS